METGGENNIFNVDVFKKLFAQCLDATFVLCDWMYGNHYGPCKFHEVFDQILPTALVLRSPYWPRYAGFKSKRFMCVCDDYGIVCLHNSSNPATQCFLDEAARAKYRDDTFSMTDEKVKPLKYKITCMPTPANLPKGYLVSAIIFVKANANPLQRKRAKQPANHFVINNRYTFVKQVKPRKQIIVFGACNSLRKSADLILSLRDNYEFPDHILDGYVLDSQEFPMWTACVSIAPMVQRTYVNTNKNKEKEAVTTNPDKSPPQSPPENIADMLINLVFESLE